MIFVVERPTTKFLPTKQYRIVPGCGLVYHDHENYSTNCPKIHCSRKFYPPKNIRYTVVTSSTSCALQLSLQEIHVHVHGVQAHIQIQLCCKTLIGMHELHGRMHPNQGLATNMLAVAVPTNPSHPMTSSTTSASRYGPLKFWLLSNS